MRSNQTGWVVACALAGVLALLGASQPLAAQAQLYRFSTPRDYELPSAVSPDGSTVLTTEHVWTPAGGFVRFAPGVGTYSRDISNTGVVVGLTDGDYTPFRSPVGGPLERLVTSGDAMGISPDGSVIVGNAEVNGTRQPFRWTAAGGLVGLGSLPSAGTDGKNTASGVSADGSVVVGEGAGAAGPEAFRWTQPTGMAGLGDLPGGEFSSGALAVSADGRVIVGYGTSAAGTEAFRWTQDGGMVGLGNLPGGQAYSRAEAASADGSVIVGTANSAPNTGAAFIWTPAGGMRSLRDVLVTEYGLGPALEGFTPWAATDVSDDGRVIVGYGYNAAGDQEGFVAVIPEPMAAAPLALAALLLRCRRGRAVRSF